MTTRPNRRTIIDSKTPIIIGGDISHANELADKMLEAYPGAEELVDEKVPKPLVDDLDITAFVDSDDGHDKVTRRSMTGIIVLVGRTSVFYYSK